VDVFDYDATAGLTGRRPFVDLSGEDLNPDGLTVDAEGGVWMALYGAGAVRRYGPDGKLDAVLTLPVHKVTACAFGGERLDELFVTTSRENLPSGVEPRAGAVFRAYPGVRGRPVRTFAG
jgi:sugar lactone lactonase YvrE